MIFIIMPVLLLVGLMAFLFNQFYYQVPESQIYVSAGNFFTFHNAAYNYAQESPSATGSVSFSSTPLARFITYSPLGDYQANVVVSASGAKFLISSYSLIQSSSVIASKTLNSLAQQLENPNGLLTNSYQQIVALTNSNCQATLVDSNYSASTFVSTFNTLCASATPAIKQYVLMEQIQ